MSDNKAEVGAPDRRRVAGEEPYEVDYLARKHGISSDEAKNLISRFGNDRATLDREAERLKLH